MRNLSLVECVELKFSGSVLKNSLCFGDCDNDGQNELIVGSAAGDLAIFRGDKCVCVSSDLGTIGAIAVGDLLNIGKNVLVVITIDGWCRVFDVESEMLYFQQRKEDFDSVPQFMPPEYFLILPFHSQRIPPNVKTIHLGDVNGDGLVEMVVGLTDRVLRTYQWRCDAAGEIQDDRNAKTDDKDDDSKSETSDAYDGRLFGVNKWEFANQIGSVALQRRKSGVSIIVGQPGGAVTIITEKHDFNAENEVEQPLPEESAKAENVPIACKTSCPEKFIVRNESPSDNIIIQHYLLGDDQKLSPTVSTEVVGNVLSDDGKCDERYGVATLDGTIMVVRDDRIEWSLKVDNQVLSLFHLHDKLVACSWNGDTYVMDGKETIRVHFEDSVAAFFAGTYAFPDDILSEETKLTSKNCFVYVTFDDKLYVYPVDLF